MQATATAQTAQSPEDRRYNVELLIFKYSNPEEFASENWPQRWSLPNTKDNVDLDNIDDKYKADFERLEPAAQSFGGMLERLDKSVRYEVLSHMAWRQRGLDKEQAIGVRVQAARKYLPQAPIPPDVDFGLFEESFIEQDFTPEVTIRQYTEQHSETRAKSDSVLYELEGEVKIVLGRFLHVHTDLLLLKPVTLTPATDLALQAASPIAAATNNNPLTAYSVAWTPAPTPLSGGGENGSAEVTGNETLYGFNINAHRRMRSGELHHLDHPLLGILIQIKPVEAPKP